MTDIIMNILQWAIPSGGIGAAIAWIANRKVKSAESAKQIHDTYKAMYQDISKELLSVQEKSDENARKNEERIIQMQKENTALVERLNKENIRIQRTLNRLSRAIEAIQLCPHRATCPVSGELQNEEDGADGGESKGKRRQQRKPHQPERSDKPRDDDGGRAGDLGVEMDSAASGQ